MIRVLMADDMPGIGPGDRPDLPAGEVG